MTTTLEQARAAFERQAWREALQAFVLTADSGSLDPADQVRLAECAYLVGEDEQCAVAWEAAHRASLEAGDAALAARCAFWLAFCLMLRGQMAQAGGWLGRTERLIAEAGLDCAASGYLLIPALLGAIDDGQPAVACDLAAQAAETAGRFGDADLSALATLGHGQALIELGEIAQGIARFDEVMVSVTSGEVGPISSGIVYCAVILGCMQLFDLPRAAEWTEALSGWCDAQPDLVPYRGQCLVHRSQISQASGEWSEAVRCAGDACRRLSDPPHPALGMAHYQHAELHRLLGAFDEAADDYRMASRNGYEPMPGLALLEMDRGDVSGAAAALGRALQETSSRLDRPPLLTAAVNVFRANGDIASARSAAEELGQIASDSTSEFLAAMAAQATGTVVLSEGDPSAALVELRAAAAAWRSLQMPYEAARVSVLVGLACSALGDQASAVLEFENAADTFAGLGARPDLDRLTALTGLIPAGSGAPEGSSPLSARESEVLAHVAAGETNRQIAAALSISQHTVGRHLENIFNKLDVTSRAAATAKAYELDLL